MSNPIISSSGLGEHVGWVVTVPRPSADFKPIQDLFDRCASVAVYPVQRGGAVRGESCDGRQWEPAAWVATAGDYAGVGAVSVQDAAPAEELDARSTPCREREDQVRLGTAVEGFE
jgi:hypothetical protein